MRSHLEDWLSPGDKSERAWRALVHFKETVSTTGRYFILCTCISLRCLCGGFWLPSCSVQQLAYFILASFVTVDAKRKRKSLFKGQKVSDMWLSTSKLLLQSFFALAARPLWDLTVDMYPHVRIFGLHCPQTSGGGSQPLHCWPDFWACSVESRPAKVGHDDVPSAEKNVSYSTGHIWLWVFWYSLLAPRGWQVLVADLAWLGNHGHWLLAWCELLRLLVMEFAFHEREIPEQI